MTENKKYWNFKALSQTEADLYLYVEIADWGAGYAAHSAQSFKNELDSLGEIDRLNIYINSPGGDVFEGVTITSMLKRKKCFKTVYVDGCACSIASVVCTVGDKVVMPSNTMQMIHNAWGNCMGNANEMRKYADSLEKITDSMKSSYLEKSNGKLDDGTLTKLMDNETWLTAQECYDYGLCDEILNAKQIAAKWNSSFFYTKNYKNVPKQLLKQLIEPTKVNNQVMDEPTRLYIQRIKNKTR